MRFGSVCSGIEAASVAWEPLGWKAAWFAEIEPFPSAVLAHHYPDVPNLGDMTKLPAMIRAGEIEAPDIFCGGTPCQAFSVAGLRKSLDDARGNLSLVFCEIADELDAARSARGEQPVVVFWENVPGVLSTSDNAFGCFLAGLAGEDDPIVAPRGKWTNAGYVLGPKRAVAWRVTDAQYFGVAQRRRRVFVVASAREGFDPAAVLFEFEGVRRDSAPSRETGEGTAGGFARSVALRGREGGGTIELGDDLGGYLRASGGGGDKPHVITMAHGQGGAEIGFDRGPTLTCNHEAPIAAYQAVCATGHKTHALTTRSAATEDGTGRGVPITPAVCVTGDVTHTLKAEGFDASEDGTGRGTPMVPAIGFNARQDPDSWHDRTGPLDTDGSTQAIAFSCKDYGADAGPISPTLRSMGHDGSHANAGGQVAVAFAQNSRDEVRLMGGDGQIVGAPAAEPGMKQTCYVAQGLAYTTKLHNTGSNNAGKIFDERTTCLDANSPPPALLTAMQVRRLTPRECERLQGFPDDYTRIPWRLGYWPADKHTPEVCAAVAELCPDGPRYKALGNSWAVPNVRWIGARIDRVLRSLEQDIPLMEAV